MRNRLLPRALLTASLLLPLGAVWAAQPSTEAKSPVLHLEAQAYTEIDQDTVIITLQATHQSSEQSVVTQALAQTVAAVLDEVKTQDVVKVSSGHYSVRPQHDKEGRITAWIGQSQLLFESTDMKAASELAAKYQEKMPVSNVAFTVSKAARNQAEKALMSEAAQAFQERAQEMALALGYEHFAIKELHLGGSGAVYRAPKSYRTEMMMAAAPAADSLPIHQGTEEVSLSLNGSIYLLDKK